MKHLPPYIYVTPVAFSCCPICGRKFFSNYVYAIQISEKECVKLVGDACLDCNAFFSKSRYLFSQLENVRIDKAAYTLNNDYNIHYDASKYSNIFFKTKTVYKQFTICRKKQIITYTIVYDEIEINEHKNTIHYSSKIAIELLNAEKNDTSLVSINDNEFVIANIKSARNIDAEIIQEINETISSKKYFDNEIPDLTTQHTLYVYHGNIKCHEKHHISEFRAEINLPEYPPIKFYVEYCYECNNFLIKYSDYSIYLKKFKLFPLKVKAVNSPYNEFNRASKSPLFLNGYTVNSNVGYTDHERQSILAYIMEYGIMERRKILDYLEMFIHDNRGEIATQKYIADKNFVLNYQLENLPSVRVFNIERR